MKLRGYRLKGRRIITKFYYCWNFESDGKTLYIENATQAGLIFIMTSVTNIFVVALLFTRVRACCVRFQSLNEIRS